MEIAGLHTDFHFSVVRYDEINVITDNTKENEYAIWSTGIGL